MKANCSKCGHGWNTESKMVKVTCPSCGSKVKIRELKHGKEKKNR